MAMVNSLFNNLIQHRGLVFAIFIIVFLGCFYLITTAPEMYQVKATIQIERKDYSIEKADQPYEQSIAQLNNTIQKLKSASLLNKTLLKLNYTNMTPESTAFNNLQKRLVIKNIPGSNVIEISLFHKSTLEGTLLVNTLIETLMEENRQSREEEVKQAITYIESSLTEVRTRQLAMTAPVKRQNVLSGALYSKYTQDLQTDLQNAEGQLSTLKEPLQAQVRAKLDAFFDRSLPKNQPRLAALERKLVAELGPAGWNSSRVKAQLSNIWREKTRIAKDLNIALLRESTAYERENLNNPEELCVYQVKLYDLQIRQQIFKERNPGLGNPSVNNRATTSDQKAEAKSLQELEDRLINKLTELENFNELSSLEINWLDRAIPLSKPYFPPSLALTAGLSLGLALLAVMILGLIFVEYRSLKEGGPQREGTL
ncbi:MAG TPA: hypothetical protein VHY08_27005 [Bacillota bacterium]|nr:hypothetical protein [Bacillota bacterium]